MLVGTLTWAVPAESDRLKDSEVPKADGDEPQFEVCPEEGEEEKDEVQVKEGQEEAAGEKDAEEDSMDVWGKEDKVKEGGAEKAEESLVPEGTPPEPPYLLPPPEMREKKIPNLEASTSKSFAWLHL